MKKDLWIFLLFPAFVVGLVIAPFPPIIGGTALSQEKAVAEEKDEEEGAATRSPDLLKAGLFKANPRGVRSRTRSGKTIADVPPFSTPTRKEKLDMFPCADCHEDEAPNPKERKLEEEHEVLVFEHGGGRFWCLTCHGSKDKNAFSSLKGKAIDFDRAYVLCGQCHFQRQKDWYFGGHGKRLDSWAGERVILSCPACHNPHSPSIKPFKPNPPPKPRKGLVLHKRELHAHPPVWERMKPKVEEPAK